MAAVPAGLPFRAGSGVPSAFHLFNCQGPREDCFLSPHFYWQKNRRFLNHFRKKVKNYFFRNRATLLLTAFSLIFSSFAI